MSSSGAESDGYSTVPAISGDGRLIAFESGGTTLVNGDTNGFSDVFVRDRVAKTTRRISVSSAGAQGNGDSTEPSISGNGRFVVFTSGAGNLVNGDTPAHADVFIRDLRRHTTKLISRSSSGIRGNADSHEASVSNDGRYVAFFSDASNLVPGDNGGHIDVFVRDMKTRTTKLATRASTGARANSDSEDASISGDGRYVAFVSQASNLIEGDNNNASDIFVRDMKSRTTKLISRSSAGIRGHGSSSNPTISANGRYVAFDSFAPNLVPGDGNGTGDVFVRDLQANTTRRASVSSAGVQGNNGSQEPSISGDGRLVAFSSDADNLADTDTNNKPDLFVRNMSAHTTRRVTRSLAGGKANGYTFDSAFSGDGRFVAFESDASNMVRHDTNATQDIFVFGPIG